MKGQTNAKAIISNAEKLYINLTTDQTDHAGIIGAIVTIAYSGNNYTYTYNGSAIQVEIPANTQYTVSFGAMDGYDTPSSQSYTSQAFYSHNISAIYTKTLYKLTTIRINQNLTDPNSMITRIADEGGVEAIRANSHRYVGTVFNPSTKQPWTDGKMHLYQLDDSDSTKYLDGTDAPISGEYKNLASANMYNVFMKLPQFYYKAVEYSTDIWDISFSYGGKPDDDYKEWDGKDLIGVYEAYYTMYESGWYNVESISGKTSSGNVSQTTFKNAVAQMNEEAYISSEGFSLVKWKHHCIMAFLFYAYYGTTDCQSVCGFGTSSYTKTTGATDSLGMEDTIAGGNGDSGSINFWGLENWWGNKHEWIDNVVSNDRVWTITEDDGDMRTISTPQVAEDGYISKLLIGEYLDMLPTAVSQSSVNGYCDYNWYGSGATVLRRSCNDGSDSGGVAYVDSRHSASYSNVNIESRLCYRGDYVIV